MMRTVGAPCMAPACIAVWTETRQHQEAIRASLDQHGALRGASSSAAAALPSNVPEFAQAPPPAPTSTTSWAAAVTGHRESAVPAQAALPPFPTSSPQVKAPPPPCPDAVSQEYFENRIASLEDQVEQLSLQLSQLRDEVSCLREIAHI